MEDLCQDRPPGVHEIRFLYLLALFLTVHILVIRGASAQQRRKPEFPGGPVVRTWCFHCWGHRFDSWSQNPESASCGPKTKTKKKQREPLLTLNMQKSPRVGCEPSVFWALATRRSLWLHHRCSQVSLGPCRLTPTWQESFHLHISLCSWFVFRVCPLSLTSSYLSDGSLLPRSRISFGPHVISL